MKNEVNLNSIMLNLQILKASQITLLIYIDIYRNLASLIFLMYLIIFVCGFDEIGFILYIPILLYIQNLEYSANLV